MSFYKTLIRPLLFRLPAEIGHEVGLKSLRFFLKPKFIQDFVADQLVVDFNGLERFGLKFRNPLGIAAGFDKNGQAVNQLASLGFGFVEVGTITYEPQKGNEKPRLFRLTEDEALINRLGFNNEGAVKVIARLKNLRQRRCIVGANIGRNKRIVSEEDSVKNYLQSFRVAREVVDYVAINVSSPNTPGLRDLQRTEKLETLLKSLQEENKSNIPLLVKIAPDLSDEEIGAIVEVCLKCRVSGIVATNTTIRRPCLKTQSNIVKQEGGLSGKPLAKLSTDVIRKIYRLSNRKLHIIGVGGIFSAEDALEKICAGASLLQLYTAFVYSGPTIAYRINTGLIKLLHQRGFSSLDEAVGSEF